MALWGKPFVASRARAQSAAAASLRGQVIAYEMTNGRRRHSGSTVVESIAPSFRKQFG